MSLSGDARAGGDQSHHWERLGIKVIVVPITLKKVGATVIVSFIKRG